MSYFLFLHKISFTFNSQMYIRDYQQPLVLVDYFNVSGMLIGAEQTGAEICRSLISFSDLLNVESISQL